MTSEQIKQELIDILNYYNEEYQLYKNKNPDWWKENYSYKEHIILTFISGIKTLIEHI